MKNFLKYIFFESYHRPTSKLLHFFVVLKKLFYNNKTNIFSEKIFLLKSPPETVVYYNVFGRLGLLILNFVSILIFNKYLNNSFIENSKNKDNFKNKKNKNVWPPKAIHIFEKSHDLIDNHFIKLLEDDYKDSLKILERNQVFKDSPWWVSCRKEFKDIFFKDDKLNITALKNFRNNFKTKAALLNDQTYLNDSLGRFNKIKSLSLFNLYHKLSSYIELKVLRMSSESFVGNNICYNYRGQRLSHRVLRHAYYASQILRNTSLSEDDQNIFMDLGGGYGGLSRILKNIYSKSTMVIIEIPEVCLMANYFLKRNFHNCKIASIKDFKNKTKITSDDLKAFDFVILPQPFIELFEDNTFELIINTTSLGEMADNMQNFYLDHIERISSKYFYSINRAEKRKEKYNAQGFNDLNFKKRWIANLYNFSHTYHIEFLGKKSK